MIYFDNSATTKPYKEVLDSFVTVSSEYFGNPSSLHGWVDRQKNFYPRQENKWPSFLTVKPSEIYFTSGGTESNN